MLRRNTRLRKEYLLKKAVEAKENSLRDRKKKIKQLVNNREVLSVADRDFEFEHRSQSALHDERALAPVSSIDNEYTYAGIKDPKVMLTTSRDPSSRLMQFVKELNLLFPNSHRLNRGSYIMKDLVTLSQKNDISDIIIVHEHRGIPDGIVISHMPLGPTIYFSLQDVVLRHDLPQKPPPMSTAAPHLVFENFTSPLGNRIQFILKYLFPPASPLTTRVLCFVNKNDVIHFRNFLWEDKRSRISKEKDVEGMPSDSANGARETTSMDNNEELKKKKSQAQDVSLTEFSLKPYRIALGTLDMKNVQLEWSLKPYFNKPRVALAN